MSSKKKSLHHQLTLTLRVLQQRKCMIPKYINQPGWLGNNHYSMDMIPPLEKQIEEIKAALVGIEDWRKAKGTAKGAGQSVCVECAKPNNDDSCDTCYSCQYGGTFG